jgi:hypothetical protein
MFAYTREPLAVSPLKWRDVTSGQMSDEIKIRSVAPLRGRLFLKMFAYILELLAVGGSRLNDTRAEQT